jgi:hypothetical protein
MRRIGEDTGTEPGGRASRRAFLRTAGGALAAALLGAPRPADAREYEIKAAFLYNFAKYVDWPAEALPSSSTTLDVGVMGKNPFGAALDTIRGKTVKGKTLRVRQVNSIQEASGVHLLFISASEEERLKPILAGLRNASVLTVAEMSGFVQNGGIINLITQNDRVRFEINPVAAERARLGLSAQLVRLATRVVRA